MHQQIRGSRLEVLAGAGHLSNLERPAAFNAVLAEFIWSIETIIELSIVDSIEGWEELAPCMVYGTRRVRVGVRRFDRRLG